MTGLMLAAGVSAIGTGAAVAVSAVTGPRQRRARAERVVAPYSAAAPARPPSPQPGAAVAVTSRLLRSAHRDAALAARLEAAGVRRQPAEWALAWIAAGAGVAVLVAMAGSTAAGILAGVLAGYAGQRFTVSILTGRRRNQFSDQLPAVLQVIAGALRAGFSLPQALERAARDAPLPCGDERRRAVSAIQLGGDIPGALDAVAARTRSQDLTWAVTAIQISRETGGNLGEVLDITARTMRERAALRRHARALAAEGRMSGWIVLALPVVLGGWLFLADRAYMRPMYTTPAGIAMTCAAVGLMAAGTAWMRVMIKVEDK